MDTEQTMMVMEEFFDLCDQAKACITGKVYAHTSLDFSSAAERLAAASAPAPVAPSVSSSAPSSVPTTSPAEENVAVASGPSYEELQKQVAACQRCKLASCRQHTVFGEGGMHPLVMVIGEGPGADEDATGRPFVGKAGQYLDKWLASIGLSRSTNVFIGNIVKCRPPENRVPEPDEIAACLPYIKRQITLVQPRLILLSGATAAHTLLGRTEGVGKLRMQSYQIDGIPTVVTYHPSGVLRNPEYRRPVWEDMKNIARMLGLTIPGRG